MEVFKNIKGYEGLYQVGTEGTIKSLNYNHTGKEKELVKNKLNTGYYVVTLHKNGKRKNHLVHRIVAETFLDNPDGLPQVNHKNEDKSDNRVVNLEWCDAKYNMNYGTAPKRRVEQQCKPVYQYTIDGVFVAEYPSASEADRQTGYNFSKICKCCRGEQKTAYNYKWSYKK